MKRSSRLTKERSAMERPTILGSGLLALDIVTSDISGASPQHWAGGTCGNVLIALAYLGWQSQPVARLKSGPAAERILHDLKQWGVSDQFVSVAEDGSTPVIVEKITKGSGDIPRHSFSWRCPECGSQFPGFKPVLTSVAEEIAQNHGQPKVFFFDRATPGAMLLAKSCAKQGALIVFEPSSIGNPVLFRQAWEVSHVVKYSHERLSELPEIGVEGGPRLQVETLGEAGLRYRKVKPSGRGGRWSELRAFSVDVIRDTAGSGDWCTAGLVDRAGRDGASGLFNLSDDELQSAFRYGQALAAWNCGFEGARGGMYSVDPATFKRQVRRILGDDSDGPAKRLAAPKGGNVQAEDFCLTCVKSESERCASRTG
jgi:sugar/nucleoside kinase (ribokinase family)